MPTPQELNIDIPDWRAGQWDIIATVAEKLGGQKGTLPHIFVLRAPPGVGKSVIATATARTMTLATCVLTNTKQLQDQYAQTFRPTMVDMRGRANFPCLLASSGTAAEGQCTIGEACEHQTSADGPFEPACPYYAQKFVARNSPEVVTSYSYYLRDSGRHKGAFGGRPLLVLDECHELEDHLRGWWAVEVTSRALYTLGVSATQPDSMAWLRALRDRASQWLDAHTETARVWNSLEPGVRRSYTAIERLSEELARLLPTLEADPKSWVFEENLAGTLVYKPVLVKEVARDTIFKSAKAFLLMSATINPADLAELGLTRDDYTYLSVPSPFPVANRPLLYWPVAKVSAKLTDGELDQWINRIDLILETHAEEKGLIHTANYKLASLLMERSKWASRLISHTALTRTSSLDSFRESQTPLVMVSPSMTTGVDLPYDLCRFQIIAKLAWPYLGDPQVSKRLSMSGGQEWYANRAATSLGQAYGRGVRAADDAAITYIIDQTFNQFRSRWARLLPSWVEEAIIQC